MKQRLVQTVTLTLNDFNEPLRMPYYRMNDSSELFDPRRYECLIPSVARAAVIQAGLSRDEIRKLPLFIGSSSFSIGLSELSYAKALAQHPQNAIPMPLCGYQDIAVILQQGLGCKGEIYTYNTACTASANALLGALNMIDIGVYRHALVIGVEMINRTSLSGFLGLQILAKTIQPFDLWRQGIVLGEGIGAVVLSADSNSVTRMRVIGGANNCDTWSITTANTDGHSTAIAMRLALKRAGIQPHHTCGIKAHGTATRAGDMAEARGLHHVFENLPPITVLKPYLGHTLGACCLNELVLYAGTLLSGFIPATPGFETPDPVLDLHPLTVEISAPNGHYLLNHFGFAGNNTVLVVEKTA
ncbi:MAG: beta-ketoacyl synthase N-terminal-like domain-containing protein [Gammaproteobacteria bacterium]